VASYCRTCSSPKRLKSGMLRECHGRAAKAIPHVDRRRLFVLTTARCVAMIGAPVHREGGFTMRTLHGGGIALVAFLLSALPAAAFQVTLDSGAGAATSGDNDRKEKKATRGVIDLRRLCA